MHKEYKIFVKVEEETKKKKKKKTDLWNKLEGSSIRIHNGVLAWWIPNICAIW